jgi:hypothetical protein
MNKYTENFTDISTEVIEKITAKVEELNCNPIMICRANNHPDEKDKLFMVLARYKNDHPYFDCQYAVWTANMFGDRASLHYGHYHISFKTALEIISNRVNDLNREEC